MGRDINSTQADCSDAYVTIYGVACDSGCAHYGENYYWCRLANGDWDYFPWTIDTPDMESYVGWVLIAPREVMLTTGVTCIRVDGIIAHPDASQTQTGCNIKILLWKYKDRHRQRKYIIADLISEIKQTSGRGRL